MYKPVEEYTVFGGKITCLYYCVAEMARVLNIDYNKALQVINNHERLNHKYYRWYYKDDKKVNNKINYTLKQKDLDGNIINQFKYYTEASRVLNVNRNIIKKWVNNKTPDNWGYYWFDEHWEN